MPHRPDADTYAALVCHTGLEPQNSGTQAGLLLTSWSLALDRLRRRGACRRMGWSWSRAATGTTARSCSTGCRTLNPNTDSDPNPDPNPDPDPDPNPDPNPSPSPNSKPSPNQVLHAHKLQFSHALVIAMDVELHGDLARRRIPTVDNSANLRAWNNTCLQRYVQAYP